MAQTTHFQMDSRKSPGFKQTRDKIVESGGVTESVERRDGDMNQAAAGLQKRGKVDSESCCCSSVMRCS